MTYTNIPKSLSFKGFTSFDIKIAAMFFMLLDHMWATIIPGAAFLTCLGRIAFPLFAFGVAEGFYKTHSRKKFALRMFIFALISEVPFNLMSAASPIFPFHQNVMFTFLLAIGFMSILEWGKKFNTFVYGIIILAVMWTANIAGNITFVDYFGPGVLTVLCFYIFHDFKYGNILSFISLFYINGVMLAGRVYNFNIFGLAIDFPEQLFAMFSFIFIFLYNGRRGNVSRRMQIASYLFYPAHMLILYGILKLM